MGGGGTWEDGSEGKGREIIISNIYKYIYTNYIYTHIYTIYTYIYNLKSRSPEPICLLIK